MSSVDQREDDVADLARRAALAASQKRRSQRERGEDSSAPVRREFLDTLAPVLERIAAKDNVLGLKLTRGPGALGIAAISDSDTGSGIDHLLTSTASALAHQSELVPHSDLGELRDAAMSFDGGAVLARWVGQDLLLVAVGGRPARVRDVWNTMRDAASEIESICSTITI